MKVLIKYYVLNFKTQPVCWNMIYIKVEVLTSDKKILLKMLHFLFSQIFNFILLESESRGFRNLIIKEVL